MDKESVIIFSFRSQDWALSTTLEIIANELEVESCVKWAFWLDNLSFPRELPLSEKLTSIFLKREIQSSKLLESIKGIFPERKIRFLDIPNISLSIPEFLENKIDIATYLELISRIRESKPSKDDYRKLIKKFNHSYLKTYGAAFQVLQSERPDKVYLYNGRFLQERAVADCCDNLGIKVVYFERFNPEWKTRFFLFEKPTHSPSYRSRIMTEYGLSLQKSSPLEFKIAGEKWFSDRKLGISQKFTKHQNISPILENLGDYIVFFHSSEDELITTDLTSTFWGTQMEAINKLVTVLEDLENLKLVIRMHPNLKYKSKKEILQWEKYGDNLSSKYRWITFLDHESKINSYDLMLGARSVVTVGSTIGVEAAYLGKKSILIGRAFHEDMGITLNPKNLQELRICLTTNLSNKNQIDARNNALNYANFHGSGGQHFRYIHYSELPMGHYFWGRMRFSRPFLIRLIFRLESKLKSIWQSFSEYFRSVQ